jgi:hypothetical protein
LLFHGAAESEDNKSKSIRPPSDDYLKHFNQSQTEEEKNDSKRVNDQLQIEEAHPQDGLNQMRNEPQEEEEGEPFNDSLEEEEGFATAQRRQSRG